MPHPLPPDAIPAADTAARAAPAPWPAERAPQVQGLRWLIATALPDKSRRKAAGWWGQTDFLVTRSHVDEEGDAFHDGVLISVWKRWDFWLALPETAPPPAGHWAARAWARLQAPARAPTAIDGLLRQYRPWGGDGRPLAWLPLDAHAPAGAQAALLQAWSEVVRYWQAAEAERRAGFPLRARLHATLGVQRVAALIALPLFTGRYNDWGDPERAGCWQGDVWTGARQAAPRPGGRQTAALKLGWRNGQEAPGDPADDAHACYQIELLAAHAPPAPGAVHPPGLALSYSQRQSEPRVPLPGDAAPHVARLLDLFLHAERQLLDAHARERAQALQAADRMPAPALARLPPFAAHASDADVLGPALMALSRDWQAAARAHATAVLAQWEDAAAHGAPPHDPRDVQAPAVLRLARTVHGLGDADLGARFHHRFAFAPGAYAAHAARHGQRVRALRWLPGGGLLAWVQTAQGLRCWQVDAAGLRVALASDGEAPPAATPRAALHGGTVHGDALGDLHGLSPDGQPLWRHHVGGAVLCVAASPQDGTGLLAVGTAAGYLALLKKAPAPDAHQPSTARLREVRRIVFWSDAPEPLVW